MLFQQVSADQRFERTHAKLYAQHGSAVSIPSPASVQDASIPEFPHISVARTTSLWLRGSDIQPRGRSLPAIHGDPHERCYAWVTATCSQRASNSAAQPRAQLSLW
jgi:hypothetical protein